jgi:hypothetical protein
MGLSRHPRIEALFSQTKLLGFGRYVLTVPVDSRLSFGYDIPTLPNQAQNLNKIIEAKVAEIKAKYKTAEVNYVGPGPAPHVTWIRSFEDKYAKASGLEGFDIYYVLPPHIFNPGDAISSGERSYEQVLAHTLHVARALRLRQPDELPLEEGLCHEYAFQRLAGAEGSISSAGLHIAALPDVVFSVFSNTGGSVDGENGYGLIQRMENQKKKLGADYPKCTLLRAAKRKIHDWEGEETLFRNEDGSHDFRWLAIGIRNSVARPAKLDVTLYDKVRYDMIGGADQASLSDEEALALWDKLLESLKFRVAVPGAPDSAVQFKGVL